MKEGTKPLRVTYDEVISMHIEVWPPSLRIDYPYSVEVKGGKEKISLFAGRSDWKVTIIHPEKEADRYTPGMAPGTAPKSVNVIIGEDIDEEEENIEKTT
jgi:hypothetical protein